MTLRAGLINTLIRLIFRLTCRLDIRDLRKIPKQGPAILITNHTSNLEGPLLYVFLRPRQTIALGKRELWEKPLTRTIMDAWNVIPIERGGMDMKALRACFGVLENGDFLCIAPEGTRSKTGKLKRGQPGTTFFASRQGVPIYPMAQWGVRDLGRHIRRLRPTRVHIRVGEPFLVGMPDGGKPGPEDRQAMADEMMYRIAALLPEEWRGEYADADRATSRYLRPVVKEPGGGTPSGSP